jgi:cellulose synthase/poly-beta-1,6-N-acetylglucosamine synthase-like glycosyltransferase
MLEILFWFSLLLVAYANVGYPALIWIYCRLRRKESPVGRFVGEWPLVSVVMIAHNEEKRISAKLRNLLQCDYPGELEIIVVCDGCEDSTAEVCRGFSEEGCRTIEAERCGKAAGLNLGVAAANGSILVFADVRQEFDPSAIRRLVMPFADSAVVGVGGSLEIKETEEGPGKGIDLYWKLEKLIRLAESRIDSCIGCTGAIYALRADSYRDLPADTLLDDVVVPMIAQAGGGRILFEPEARAYDPQALTAGNERRRKTRTLAGNFQMLFRYPGWLVPFRSRLWWQLLSHKYMRLAVPFLLVVCFSSNALLAGSGRVYLALFLMQLISYLFAFLGMGFPFRRLKIFSIPAGFVCLQCLCVLGLVRYIRMRIVGKPVGW